MRIGKRSGHLFVENQKVKRKRKASLKSDTDFVFIKYTRGKLEVLERHYQILRVR